MSRTFLRAALAVFASAVASSGVPLRAQKAEAAPPVHPNILIIVTDDQRWGTVKHMPQTRRLFGRGGTNFAQAYATTPLCCPSRASIFTGRYAHNHGVKTNRLAPALAQGSTLQAYLHRAGYRTAIFGKYLNRWELTQDPPYFDEWATYANGRVPYYDAYWNVNGGVSFVRRYATDFIKRRAVDFLRRAERNDRRPWLMYLTPGAPHGPAIPEPEYAYAPVPPWTANPAVTETDKSDKPPYVEQSRAPMRWVRRLRRNQLLSLLSVDEMVGRVFKVLDRLGDDDRTLAFYLSDNGFLWGEHGLSGVLGKRPPYTQSVKIPLLVRWPGRVPPGRVARGLAANIDVAPTALQAAAITPRPGFPMDGRPLTGRRARARLLLEYYTDGGPTPEWASTRTGSYQYIEYYAEDSTTVVFREYYDLVGDPWSLGNPLGDADLFNDPDVEPLHARLTADRRCGGAACP